MILGKEDIMGWKCYWLDWCVIPDRQVGQVYREKQPTWIYLGMTVSFGSKSFEPQHY